MLENYEFLFILEDSINDLTQWCTFDRIHENLKRVHVYTNVYKSVEFLSNLIKSLHIQSQLSEDFFVLFKDIYVTGYLTPSSNDVVYVVYEYYTTSLQDYLSQ